MIARDVLPGHLFSLDGVLYERIDGDEIDGQVPACEPGVPCSRVYVDAGVEVSL